MTSFERPRYVAGKLLTAADLELEQRYHIEKRRLLNRIFHAPGIVHGLEVSADPKGFVSVAPGLALDRCGREIQVCEPAELAIPDTVDPVSICVVYAEEETERGTIRETYELTAANAIPEQAVVLAILEGGVLQDRA